jgi:hypothetical protein
MVGFQMLGVDDVELTMRLQEDVAGARFACFALGVVQGGRRAEHCDLGDGLEVLREAFAFFDELIGFADDPVSLLVHLSGWMELVADAAFRADRKHVRAFVFKRRGPFEAAEFAPAEVEFASHAEEVEASFGEVFRVERIVVVAPAAGGQRLDLEVREVGEVVVASAPVAVAVVEYAGLGVERPDAFADLFKIVDIERLAELLGVLVVLRVEAGVEHALAAARTVAGGVEGDVEEEPYRIEAFDHFLRAVADEVDVGSVEAERTPAPGSRVVELGGRRRRILRLAVLGQAYPVRMQIGHALVPADGQVDRSSMLAFLQASPAGAPADSSSGGDAAGRPWCRNSSSRGGTSRKELPN